MGPGKTTLIVSRTCQVREADNIPDRIDVWQGGLIGFIHRKIAAMIDFDAQLLKPHTF